MILEPQPVVDLLGFFPFAFDARRADEGCSPFSAAGGKTKVGEKVFDERLSLFSDPWHPELPGSPVAQGGIPAQKIYLVRQGVVENLIYSRFWAGQKQKAPSPGPVNAILQSSGPTASLDEMIRGTSKGLLVGRFWYLRSVDPRTQALTGLTREGVWYVSLGVMVESADATPTGQHYELFEILSRQLDAQLARRNEIVTQDLAALNNLIGKENVPVVGIVPQGRHRRSRRPRRLHLEDFGGRAPNGRPPDRRVAGYASSSAKARTGNDAPRTTRSGTA